MDSIVLTPQNCGRLSVEKMADLYVSRGYRIVSKSFNRIWVVKDLDQREYLAQSRARGS